MAALTSFIRLSDSLIEFEAELVDITIEGYSTYSLEVHREEMKALWSKVKQSYEECLRHFPSRKDDADEDGRELEAIKGRYRKTYHSYVRGVAKISEEIQNCKDAKISAPKNPPNSVPLSSNMRLPPCDTEIFTGEYLSWPSFRDMFTAVYVNNQSLSQVEKLFYLNQKTRGEAREIVKNAPLTNDGFDVAWKNLKDRFENKRILVNSQLRLLFNIPTISEESGVSIKNIQRQINSCISTLKLYEVDISNWDPIIVFLCSSRLPSLTLALWEQSLQNKMEIPKWKNLDTFLTSRYQTLETVSDIKGSINFKSNSAKPSNRNNQKKVGIYHANVSEPVCKLCTNQSHIIRNCPLFLRMNVADRLSCIKTQGLCINCFSRTHVVKDCTSTHSCFKCKKRHNTLLHRETGASSFNSNSRKVAYRSNSNSGKIAPSSNFNSIEDAPSTSSNSSSGASNGTNSLQSTKNIVENVQNCFISSAKSVLLGTAMVHIIHLGTIYPVRALLDSGSEGTFISERLFRLLKLPSRSVQAQISGLNNAISAKSQKVCSFTIGSPVDTSFSIEANALVIPHLTGNLPTCTIDSAIFSKLPHIQLADATFYRSSHIDLLIGGDLFPEVLLSGIKHNICGSLLGQETIFGWILTGPVKQSPSHKSTLVSYYNEVALEKVISRFWEVEDPPQKRFQTESDLFCEEYFVRTTKRNDEGRYIVSLPFKEEFSETFKLGHSRSIANAQFLRNEARLLKNAELKNQYDDVVNEYLKLNHMQPVSIPTYSNFPSNYYLPHHAVLKPESTTTKVRVVFNASSATSNGVSLNDVLHVGPILQSDLTMLILKWRLFRFVFNSDIQKMYRQILVDPNHTPFQRILFRDSPSKEVRDYELKTVTFGVNCAPYLAIRTLLKLADDVERCYPLASNILRKFMYVDDALGGGHDISTTIKARNELISALSSAGFELRKWTSNSLEVLHDLPKDHLLHNDFLQFDDSSSVKTLGVRWNARLDSFYFNVKQLKEEKNYTKRNVLSQIAKLFDPAGWLAPCIVLAKILMQQIWLEKIDWDDNLPENCLLVWKNILANYVYFDQIQIPRWIGYTPDCKVEIHGFCDASEKAYAACIYIRVESKAGPVSTYLLTAKTRVAPVKTISLPRLELCGAVLLSEVIETLLSEINISNYKVFLWTDSTIVLSWLQKPPCVWKTFVANRISKILQNVGQSNWFHVDSQSNPADIASRGLLPNDLIKSELWWYGPSWLRLSKKQWPTLSQIEEETQLERKPVKSNFTFFQNYEDLLDRFSSFSKAIRVIAYILRFFKRTHASHRLSFKYNSKLISNDEVQSVRLRLITLCQKVAYPEEYRLLSKKQSLSSSSGLLNLNPFLDDSGTMRVSGRLVMSPALSYEERHPIIMPYNCRFTRLLIQFIHDITLHGGNQLMLRLVRLQFWIPRVKNLIKSIIHQCKTCVLYKQKVGKQLMGVLPAERSVLTRPFFNTGLDFAGPFDIKNYTGRACLITKGYVCVFVCFSTKAVHLEATTALTTPAFLAAFNRFVARRGCPLNLYSDNGKTFVGASKEINRAFLQASRSSLSSNFSQQNLSWHFIPPGAPHMGGLWEAGVKSFKTHFKKIAGSFRYTFEEFSTLLSRIEACLNSRPMSPMSENPNDVVALTPGHFLIGGPLLAPIEPTISDKPISIVNRWQKLQALHQHFCTRWKNEYLIELHKRNKWKSPQENISVDTMVVVRDENLPPNEWRLGRVTKVFHGKDDKVRVVELLTERGSITRPITKLVVLPIC